MCHCAYAHAPGALNVPQPCLCGACAGSTKLPSCRECRAQICRFTFSTRSFPGCQTTETSSSGHKPYFGSESENPGSYVSYNKEKTEEPPLIPATLQEGFLGVFENSFLGRVGCQSVACCLLPVACFLLSVVCFLLSFVCCLLSVVCCLLSVVCCLLSVVCCLLSVVCCLLQLSVAAVCFLLQSLPGRIEV